MSGARAEQEFRDFYTAWLRQHSLTHGRTARLRFTLSFPALCGHNVSLFHRGYAAFLAQHELPASLAAFVRYCAPRWRLAGPARRQLLHRFTLPPSPQTASS